MLLCLCFSFFNDESFLAQYLKDSIDQIVGFFKSSTAISQTIALETAAAMQVLFPLEFGLNFCKIELTLVLEAHIILICKSIF